MDTWVEYRNEVEEWNGYVLDSPSPERYSERWQARLRHPSWQEKREFLIWLCESKCERCHVLHHPSELQLHHLHYDSLWYESHQDLELLCASCHRQADRERADEQAAQYPALSLDERARRYMEIANRWSGQRDWPVSYQQAIAKLTCGDWEDC